MTCVDGSQRQQKTCRWLFRRAIPPSVPCKLHESLMGSYRLRPIAICFLMKLRVAAVRIEFPRLPLVAKANVNYLPQFLLRSRRQYGRHHLYPLRQVPIHPVR